MKSSPILRAGLSLKPIRYSSESVSIVLSPSSHKKAFPTCSQEIVVKGPRGSLSFPLFPFLKLGIEPTSVSIGLQDDKETTQKVMRGTTRANLQNMITGVTEGFDVTLKLVGIGYRAQLLPPTSSSLPALSTPSSQPTLSLRLGYAHSIDLKVPEGITATVPTPQRIFLNGNDKQKVTELAAQIRKHRPPEPYNQKGIFVNDETIRKKEGKKR